MSGLTSIGSSMLGHGVDSTKGVVPITRVSNVSDCKCGSNDLKIMYSGEQGYINCKMCENTASGTMSFSELMYRWNSENRDNMGDE